MKKITLLFLSISSFLITSCSSNEDELAKNTNITVNFTHNWNEQTVTGSLVSETILVNAKGNRLSIDRLRYLVSNIYLENSSGITTTLKDYLLIDVGEGKNLESLVIGCT